MSAYFQRLLSQSGVRLAPPPTSAVSLPSSPSLAGAPPSPSIVQSELVELHDEQERRPFASSIPSPSSPESVPLSSRPAPLENRNLEPRSPTAPSSAEHQSGERVVTHETQKLLEETVTIGMPSPIKDAAPAPPRVSVPARDAVPAPKSVGPAQPSIAAELPAEIMDAVMKWIAAGSAPTTQPVEAARKTDASVSEVSSVSAATNAPSQSAVVREPAKIPERVIELVESHFETAPAPVRPVPPASQPSRPAPEFTSPPESPVHVSIGSIQVRIDAPAPAPLRAARAATPAPTAAPRSRGISQLRRHYIIPH